MLFMLALHIFLGWMFRGDIDLTFQGIIITSGIVVLTQSYNILRINDKFKERTEAIEQRIGHELPYKTSKKDYFLKMSQLFVFNVLIYAGVLQLTAYLVK